MFRLITLFSLVALVFLSFSSSSSSSSNKSVVVSAQNIIKTMSDELGIEELGGNGAGAGGDDGREEWPEMVGMSGEECKTTLQRQHPGWKIQVIPEDSMVTMDYRTDRVRIFVNEEGKVARAPRVG